MNTTEISTYDNEATQEILRLAVRRRKMDFFTREDLIRAAAEMDIPESAVIEAESFVRERQSEIDDRAEYRRARLTDVGRGVVVGVPILILIFVLHVFTFVAQMLGALKGAAKGIGALFFAKSTRHEVAFQAWRNKRFYMTEYGSEDPKDMLGWYFKTRECEGRDVLAKWLVETNGIDPETAEIQVSRYASQHLSKVIPPETRNLGSTTAASEVQINTLR